MRLKFLATGSAPEQCTITNETVNGIDLSVIEHGGEFVGNDATRAAGIRDAVRDDSGTLWVTLCQEVGPGHWTESGWIDAEDYDPEAVYVVKQDKPHSGKAWAKNGRGERVYV